MNPKSKFIFFVLVILTFSFIWGVGVGVYKWFPYFHLLELKKLVIPNKNKQTNKTVSVDNSYIHKHAKSISIKSVLLKREELKKKIISNVNSSNISKVRINKNSERITTEIYNNKVNAILTFSSKTKKCLKIYIQGHGGNPFFYLYHNKLLNFFSKEGCDFLSMSMTGLGLNEGNFSYPSRYGEIALDKNMAKEHKNYAFFYDKNNPNLDPLTLFIAPHYNIIKSLAPDYRDISIMGISGGGWYTVWLSALIPKIRFSVSYAGSLPIEYRKFEGVGGDWEQQNSQIYDYISYWELYKLMTLNENGETNRRAILVYNDEDDCCFYNPYPQDFKSELDKLNWKNLDVIIDKNNKHVINVELMKKIYKSKK